MYEKRIINQNNVFIYKSNNIDITTGRPGLETLSTMYGSPALNEITVARVNLGLYNFNGSSEHLWGYSRKGIISSVSTDWTEDVICKNGTVIIGQATAKIQIEADFTFGISWSLVKDGKIDLYNASVFDHSDDLNPRTMSGQLYDGTFILVVVDGRSSISKGMTAQQQAELMLKLGCRVAWNHDGGGSSEMIFIDKIVNKPSDGHERKIGSAMVCYATPTTFPVIRYRSKGTYVHWLQRILISKGYNPKGIDGKFGYYGTRVAVMLFQKANGLKDDGVVGPNTWKVLIKGIL